MALINRARPARARIQIANSGQTDRNIEIGRTLLDTSGLPWRVDTPATIPANGQATLEATQQRSVTISHTVATSTPFYAIEIPQTDDDGASLCAIAVNDSAGEYVHRERYINTAPGERVFHVEADDRQRLYARFGMEGIVGVQPKSGQAITITAAYTHGDAAAPEYGSPFALDYLAHPDESRLELSMSRMLAKGQPVMPMAVLRDLARYPSVYNVDAVFLGEFDFLIRRNYPDLQFLSVWNESTEERVRGASVDNINALFVACLSATGDETVIDEPDPEAPVVAQEISLASLTATQQAIRATIAHADDSYRVRFFSPVRSRIPMTIHARISTSYIASDVQAHIVQTVLDEYGQAAASARRGRNRPLYQRVYALLKATIPALSIPGADLTVSIHDTDDALKRPELWRFVDASSLTVTVETADIVLPGWGG